MRANTDYSTSTVSNPYFFSNLHPPINRTPTKENQKTTCSPSPSTTTHPLGLCELPEDQLLALLTSSALPSHFAILEKVAAAITQKQEEKAIQLALCNDNPLPDLPLITSDQASVIIKDLSKQISINIPEINCCVQFTPLEFFFYLLEKSSESDSKLPEILDIECIGYHVTSLLPGIANQIAQILLKTPSVSLDQDVINKLEGNGNDLAYRIKIPLSKVDFFQHYFEAFVRFLSEKAIYQNKLNVPLPKVEEFLEAQCTVHLPKIFYNNCYASISIPNQYSPTPYKLVIAQHMGESALLKNTLHLSIKPLVEKLKNLENQPQIQTSFIEKEAFSFIHLSNDAQNFWNAQFDRLPKPIPTPESIPHLEARKELFDTAIHSLATKELWLACVDRLTGRLHLNEPIYSENQYAGWLQLVCETLNGARPASLGMEKKLVEASFDILENKGVSHPLEIQKILNTCPSKEQWEALTISFLKTICANNFELSIAMLVQTCITLQRTKGKDHIASLWANMSSHLAAIQPKNNSNTSSSIWSHIYEIMSQEDKAFDAVVALLETHAFLALSQESTDSKIKYSLCLYEGKPAFRITDGLYCLHLLANVNSFWETFHAHIKTIESNEKFNEISSLITSKNTPEANNAISRNKKLLGLDYSAIHKTVETFLSSTKSPYWQIFAIKTLLALCASDATLLSWKTTQLLLQALSSMEENTEQQELINKILHLSTFNNYANTKIPSELLWSCTLMKNVDPQNYQKDVLQAYSLWTSYEKTAKPFDDKTLELELLIKIAAYRPDLAANMFQKLFTKDFFETPLHEQKIKEYITSICRSLETVPTHKNEKIHLSLQSIVDTFQNPSINTWMFKQLMIGTDSCNVLSEKTLSLLLKTFPCAHLNNTDIVLKNLTEDKLKQFLNLVTSSHLKDSVILDCLITIFTLRKKFCANTQISSDFDKNLLKAIIDYTNRTQSNASILLQASQLAAESNASFLSTQATFLALAIEHASPTDPFLLLAEFKKANIEEQQTIIKQILDSPKKQQAFELQLLLNVATCRPDLAAEMFQVLLNKNFFRVDILQSEIKEYVSSLCQSLKTSPESQTEKLYLTLQKIIDTFPSIETYAFGQLLINTDSDGKLPSKTQELLLKTLPYVNMTDADLPLKSISMNQLEQLLEGISSSNQNPELLFDSLDHLLTLRENVSDNTERSSAFDKKLIEAIIQYTRHTQSYTSLLAKASQRAADSNLLSLSSQAALTAMKIGGTSETNTILSCLLLNNLKKESLEEQQTLIKQILNFPKVQEILESYFKESFETFFTPSLMQSFTSIFATNLELQQLARQFFKFLIQLCKLNDATDNYHNLLPLAHICLLETPSSKSAFRKCLFEFRSELLDAAFKDRVNNSKLIAFFEQFPVSTSKDPVKKESFQMTQEQLITIVSNPNELISFLHPFTDEKTFQKFLESIPVNKLVHPFNLVTIDKIFTPFLKTIFKLAKTENNITLSNAICMWNHIESIFVKEARNKRINITKTPLMLYRVLLSGLNNSNDFDKHLTSFLSQLKKYNSKEIYKTFTPEVLKYPSSFPQDIQKKYIHGVAHTYISLFIDWHTQSINSKTPLTLLKIPFRLLIEIGEKISLETYLDFINQLESLKSSQKDPSKIPEKEPSTTSQAFSHIISLTEGVLKSRSELPPEVLEKIIPLLKATPFPTTHFLIPCLKAGKDILPEETRKELWEELFKNAEIQFKTIAQWRPAFRTICQVHFDLIINYAAQFPVDTDTAKNLLYFLSYICVDEPEFHSKYIEKAIRFCTNKANFKPDACPTLTPQEIRLEILQRMLSQPVQSPELFERMLDNSLAFLKEFPDEPLNNQQLVNILYELFKINVSDSCFNPPEEMYDLYHNSFNDLAKELIKRTTPSQEEIKMPYITYLILNAKTADSIDSIFVKKAIQEYLKSTQSLYHTRNISDNALGQEGYLYFRRLKAIGEHGIREELFNNENFDLLLDISNAIMEIAYDYPTSSHFFTEMATTAIQLISSKVPSTMEDYKKLKDLNSNWILKLKSLKPLRPLSLLKILKYLMEKLLDVMFKFIVDTIIDDVDMLQKKFDTLKDTLKLIPVKSGIQETGYKKILAFSSFVIPDSSFTDMYKVQVIEKEYAALNNTFKSIIKLLSEGKNSCPPILALLYLLEEYKENSSPDLPKQIHAYFECLKSNYTSFKQHNDSKHGGYVIFKRLSILLMHCSIKKITEIPPEQYLEMENFLNEIASDYIDIPTIHSHMKSSIQTINRMLQRMLQPTV